MNLFLKFFSIETLIEFVLTYLTSTVKNPSSDRALRLVAIVTRLRDAADDFLRRVGGGPLPQ